MPESNTKASVQVTDVTCSFGSFCALQRISFQALPGSVLGIVGPNGAGKTTLIDTICGLIRPTSGTIQILGEDVRTGGARLRARMGVLAQETSLYDEVSALQNLRFAAALYNVPDSTRRVAEVLELVGLSARAKDVVRMFSGGMQRRLAIARALVHNPPLLILDEPTVGVDVEARHQIWAHIRSLKTQGHTVILTTNYLDEAEALCDQMIILRNGQLVAKGTPAELTARTGRCLELTFQRNGQTAVAAMLKRQSGVLRVENVDFGVRLYLAAEINAEEIVQEARRLVPIDGFRTRSPDLNEVFLSLQGQSEIDG